MNMHMYLHVVLDTFFSENNLKFQMNYEKCFGNPNPYQSIL